MMPTVFRITSIAWLLAILPITGCGTIANVVQTNPEDGRKDPFGGVRHDVTCIQQAASGEYVFKKHPSAESQQYPRAILLLCCAIDLPFSLIGDVVTGPYTAIYSYINQPSPVPPLLQVPTEGQPSVYP